MDAVGVIHGRFQVLHKGHMEYLLAGKERCRYLVIGIANPDMQVTKYNEACPHRSEDKSNPLTYYERFQMLQGSLMEYGVSRTEFDIVPFPINVPELLFSYVPQNAKFYMTIYDAWGMEKKKILEEIGCNVEVMWQRGNETRFTSGSEVRRRIAASQPWEQLVPDFVYRYILENTIDVRIRNMYM